MLKALYERERIVTYANRKDQDSSTELARADLLLLKSKKGQHTCYAINERERRGERERERERKRERERERERVREREREREREK